MLVGSVVAEVVNANRPKAVDFSARTIDGKDWSLAEHRGKRPVLLSFFATWCSPCQEEFPHLLELRKKYADRGLQVVLLTREDEKTMRDAGLDRAPMTVLIQADAAFEGYKVDSIPRTLFFEADGGLAMDLAGFDMAGLKQIEKRLEKLPPPATALVKPLRTAAAK